jgi:hypothetical protein
MRASSAGPRSSGSSRTGPVSSALVGMVLAEQDDEWQDGRRYFSPESMTRLDVPPATEEMQPALLLAS